MITVVQCVYDLTLAGAQQVVHHLVSLCDRNRFRPLVYAFADGPIGEDLRCRGDVVRIFGQRAPFFDPTLAIRLSRSFREDGVEVVHTHLFGADLHASVAARGLRRLPVVTTVHNERPDNWRQGLVGGRLLHAAQRVVPVGRRLEAALLARWPSLRPRIRTIENGVCDSGDAVVLRDRCRSLLGLGSGDLVVGAIGRLAPQKAPLDLVAAFAQAALQSPLAKLVMVGDGPLRGEVEAELRRTGLKNRVVMAGNVPNAARLLPGFDLLVLASHWEGLPMVVLEAMMAGVPVVATSVGAVGEVLRHNDTGWVVPPARPEILADAILKLLREPGLRTRIGNAGRQEARERYSAARMVAAYEALYDELAGG